MECMTRKGFIKVLILVIAAWGLCKIGPWQPTEEDRQWAADKAAYAEYSVYVNEIREAFARQMFEEMRLVCTGDRGRMHGKLEEMGLEFNAYRRATVKEARALQLMVMEKLVQAINAHEKLQPFLDEKPFTYKRVKVAIAFEGPNGQYCDGGVGRVSNVTELAGAIKNRNKFFYTTIDPLTGNIVDLFDEPYEDALRLAQASPLPNPLVHQTTPLEEAIDEILPAYAKVMGFEAGFQCWSIGGKITDAVEDIGVKFVVLQRATQDEARKLAVYAAETLLKAIHSSEKLKPFLREYPFPASRLRIHICFRKKNYCSYEDGSMESVAVEGGEVTYFQEPTEEQGVYSVKAPVFAKEDYQEACVLSGIKPTQNISLIPP